MINARYSILNSGYVGAVEVTFIAITMGIQTSICWYRWPPIAVFTSGITASHQKSDDSMHEKRCTVSIHMIMCVYACMDC